jgi:transposase-like protein
LQSGGVPANDLAKELGVSIWSLRKWSRQYRKKAAAGAGAAHEPPAAPKELPAKPSSEPPVAPPAFEDGLIATIARIELEIPATPEAASLEDQEEWIFTLSRLTGDVLKVERVDPASGERRELSLDEYAALRGEEVEGAGVVVAEDYSAYGYDPYAAHTYDPYGYDEGYYQGMADLVASLSQQTGSGLTPEEQAYYQGIADYAASVGLA